MNQNAPNQSDSVIQPPSSKATLFWREVLGLLLLAIAYWLTVRLGFLLVAQPEGVASIWPASGFALAILLLRPKRQWPILLTIIFVINVLGNWSGGNSLLVSLGYALANALEPALGAWVMLNFCKSKITFENTNEIIALLFVGTVVNGVTALLGAFVSTLAFHSTFMNAWYIWWAADGLGIILITPFIISWTPRKRILPPATAIQVVEISILVLIMAVFAFLLFGPFTIAEKPLLRNYMFFPFLIWLAFMRSPRGVARVLLLIAVIAAWNTLQGFGIFSFASQDQAERLVSLQIFLTIETFSGLLLSAIITQRKYAEFQREAALLAMRTSEAKYQAIFDDAPIGIFQSTPQGQYRMVNPSMARLYGYDSPQEMMASITDISHQIYVNPSDRLEFQSSLAARGEVLGYIGKHYRKDQSIVWTQTTARAVKDAQGDVLYYEGFIMDITGRKQSEFEKETALEALRESEEQFRIVFEKSSIGYTLTSVDGYYLKVNQAFSEMLGYTVEEMVGKNWKDITVPEDIAANQENISRILIGEQNSTTFEKRYLRKDGSIITVFISTTLLRDEQNTPRFFITNILDITERKQAEIKLQYLSLHDALTGLNNRAFFEESMEHLEHGRQFPISVLMADVDGLKNTNDQFGHAAGDRLLKRAANVLIAAFRVEDVIARIGGDEFAVLLLGTSGSEAEAAMPRLRTILNELNAASDGPALQISCGLCTAEQGDSLIETLKAADANMYREKQRRNGNTG